MPWLLVFPFFAVYLLFGAYRLHGGLQILPDFGLSSVIVVLFVGLTEELVFRGWLLNLTYSESHKGVAIGINAVLFLMIHFPKWIMDGTFFSNFAHFGFISILLLSVLFSVIFVKTKSLLLPIGLHMFWDFLMMMVYSTEQKTRRLRVFLFHENDFSQAILLQPDFPKAFVGALFTASKKYDTINNRRRLQHVAKSLASLFIDYPSSA